MDVDIVRELINLLLEAASREGTLSESIAIEVEKRFRQQHSGETFYIRRNGEDVETRKKTVIKTYLNTDTSTKDFTRQNGISRSTLYRYLKR